jgi:hypothetical protein
MQKEGHLLHHKWAATREALQGHWWRENGMANKWLCRLLRERERMRNLPGHHQARDSIYLQVQEKYSREPPSPEPRRQAAHRQKCTTTAYNTWQGENALHKAMARRPERERRACFQCHE